MKTKLLTRLFLALLLLLAALSVVRLLFLPKSSPVGSTVTRLLNRHALPDSSAHQPRNRLEANLFAVLHRLEVRDEEISTRLFIEDTLREIDAAVPRGRPLEWVLWHVLSSTEGTGYRVDDCLHDKRSDACRVRFRNQRGKEPTTVLTLTRARRYFSDAAKMAVFLEEFEFAADQTTMSILSFPAPLTLSLVADKKKAGWAAQAATEYNKEIVIALPLESQTLLPAQAPSSMIMVHHSEEQIRRTIGEFADIVPHFSGFCNLFGSRACEDSRVMRIVLDETKRRHAYFIDTRRARSSVIPELAEQLGVPHAEVTASIKSGIDSVAIMEEIRRHCFTAQKRGRILLSTRSAPPFIKALGALREELEHNGVRLVPVSEIVSQPGKRRS